MLRNGLFRRDKVVDFARSFDITPVPPRFPNLAEARKNGPPAIVKLFVRPLTAWKP
jgi:hypothetical protein